MLSRKEKGNMNALYKLFISNKCNFICLESKNFTNIFIQFKYIIGVHFITPYICSS